MKQTFNTLKIISLAVVLSFGLSYAIAWTAPSTTPPTGNVSAPINTGSATASQTITGKLTVTATTTTGSLVAGGLGLFANSLTTNEILFTDGSKQGTAPGGTLIAFTTITASNPAWAPNSKTKRMVVLAVGGGSAGGGGTTTTIGCNAGYGGYAGSEILGSTASVSGTYAVTIGAGGAGVVSGNGKPGLASSFIGTGINISAPGAPVGGWYTATSVGEDKSRYYGESQKGPGGAGTSGTTGLAAAPNTGAGGGGSIGCGSYANQFWAGGSGGSGVVYVWEYS